MVVVEISVVKEELYPIIKIRVKVDNIKRIHYLLGNLLYINIHNYIHDIDLH